MVYHLRVIERLFGRLDSFEDRPSAPLSIFGSAGRNRNLGQRFYALQLPVLSVFPASCHRTWSYCSTHVPAWGESHTGGLSFYSHL